MTNRAFGRQGVLWTVALVAGAAGALAIIVALRAQVSAPAPHTQGAINPRASTRSATSGPSARPVKEPLGPSRPLSIEIPAIGLRSRVNPIGLASDGTIAVPQPGPLLNQAAWFENSPTPGQPGPAIIEGHVDSESGPSVFFELGKLRPGQRIMVTRADQTRLTFTVDATRDFLKSRFPTQLVYGAKDLSSPALRLITCSQFDESSHHHIGNAVVFAHLTDVTGQHHSHSN